MARLEARLGGEVGQRKLLGRLSERMGERSLVRRLKKGDEAAFRQLVSEQQGRVFALVFRMVGNQAEAEDVAQEVFIAVFRNIGRFREESRLSTWIHRIAYNTTINRLKQKSRVARQNALDFDALSDSQLHGSAPAPTDFARPDDMAEGREAEGVLQTLLLSLSDEQRSVVVMRDMQGMTYEEISQVLALPVGTVKSRLHRARSELARGYARYRSGEAKARAPADATDVNDDQPPLDQGGG